MNKDKYEVLGRVLQKKYHAKIRFDNGKLGIDVYGPTNNKLKPIRRTGYKSVFFNMYMDGNKKGFMFSNYELICYMAKISVLGKAISLKTVLDNKEKVKQLIRRELRVK
jgi:hypothetical protein